MKKGFTLMEVIVSFGIMTIVVASLLPIVSWLITRSKFLQYDAAASVLLQEGMEISYNMIVTDWTGFLATFPDGIYHPAVDAISVPEKWTLVTGSETNLETRFERSILISPVCRNDSTGEIVTGVCGSGSTLDGNSRLVTTTVKWLEQQTDKTITASLLVTNLTR